MPGCLFDDHQERTKAMAENEQDLFDWIREIELAKAMQDRESLVKQQIKMETIRTAREIFAQGYQIATGTKAWDEQDER